MPAYEYTCKNHHRWDVIKPMSDCGTPETCGKCGEPGKRDYSASSFAVHGGPTTNGGTGKRAAAGRHNQKKTTKKKENK